MSPTDRIEKRVTLRAPVARVWRAIADAQEFGRWFGFTLEGPFVAGQTIRGTFDGKLDEAAIIEHQKKVGVRPSKVKLPADNVVFCTVERIEPERYFSFRWIPYGIDAEADPDHEPTTLVEFQLEPAGDGTLVTIVESGFDRVPEHRRERAFRMNEGGWAAQAEVSGRMSKPRDRAVAEVFFALGDPTRLSLLSKLGAGGARSATALSDGAKVTRQAIAKHLQVLADAGLVTHEKRGREVLYALDPQRLTDARAFLDGISASWDRAIDRLRKLVETD